MVLEEPTQKQVQTTICTKCCKFDETKIKGN